MEKLQIESSVVDCDVSPYKQVRMTIQVISQPASFSRNEKSLQNTTHKKRTLPLAKFFFVLIYFCKILQSSFKPSTIASCSTGAILA
jgi:hypothetical protein